MGDTPLTSSFSPSSGGLTPANPFSSQLARDALLIYAYRLYETPHNPTPSGTSLVSLILPALRPQTTEVVYRSQLMPLLTTLRTLHPRHLPTLLLLGCVHHALGEFATSVLLNEEILSIDNGFVRIAQKFFTTRS
jgi:protein O-GlcNAc transferase